MFAKSILRMGVPVAARNIFPSNIQGLPTWYEVRISEAGHLGRRGGVDLMVAMNPQTWDQDVASIEPGGYLFYDSTKPLPPSTRRADIEIIGIPLTAICNAAYTDPRQRQLFKNIIYLGALAHLLTIEQEVLETLVREEFGSKANLIDANFKALAMGREAAAERFEPIGLRMRRSDAVGDRIYVEGNTAAALGAVYGGATVCAWYPITPSTSLAEAFTAHCQKLRVDPATGEAKFAIIQGEDEIASIGIVVGAGWNGARAFTCTSGPGISLMNEFIGLSYFAEIPAVIFDVQRGGPSTGMPTRTQQSDILLAAYASHGDTKHPLLVPRGPGRVLRLRRAGLRPRRPAADHHLRDARPRHRHERVALPALHVGRRAEARPWQGDDLRGAGGRQGLRPLPRRRRRRHPLPHPAQRAPGPRRLLHPRHLARPLRPLQRGRAGLRRQHGTAAAQVRDRQEPDPGAGRAGRPSAARRTG